MKITTKTWLAKFVAIFTHRTSLLHRISPLASFCLKKWYIFSFHSSFGVLIFTFIVCVWMSYLFLCYKEQQDFFFPPILQIYKDSQFNNTKIKNSKIQVQNKTQTLRKSYTFLSKVCTRREHVNINNYNITIILKMKMIN